VTLTQHAHIDRFPTSNFNFGQFFFIFYLSVQPLAQPQFSLLPGEKTLSVQWKTLERLFSELQASAQGIAMDSSRFMGYSNTMRDMKKPGVVPTNGYYRGPPQIIKLDVECTGNPKVKISLCPHKGDGALQR
jgi:hypothetical protein